MAAPKVNSASQKQLDACQDKFDEFQENIESMTKDRLDKAPSMEMEQQTKMSSREVNKYDAPYIKPIRSIARPSGGKDGAKVYWDEKNRAQRDRDWEYVKCVCENNEIIGEQIELWSAKWGCDPAHQWKIPTNKPVWIPRHIAEQIQQCKYHRLRMEDRPTSTDGDMTYYGSMSVDRTIHRLDARPTGSHFIAMGS